MAVQATGQTRKPVHADIKPENRYDAAFGFLPK